ncbi:LPS translocon maturation chaperone LptM [Stenotrophomonas maltophilia]
MKIPHRNVILIPLAAASLLFLAACGNKGPLVLPQKPVPVEEAVEPAAEPATGATPAQTEGSGTPATTADPAAPTTPPAPAPAKKAGGGNG